MHSFEYQVWNEIWVWSTYFVYIVMNGEINVRIGSFNNPNSALNQM